MTGRIRSGYYVLRSMGRWSMLPHPPQERLMPYWSGSGKRKPVAFWTVAHGTRIRKQPVRSIRDRLEQLISTMDPAKAWDEMLQAYGTKQWLEALDAARELQERIEAGGFSPQPMIGSTTGNMTCQLDAGFSRAICLAACYHTIDRSFVELVTQGANGKM